LNHSLYSFFVVSRPETSGLGPRLRSQSAIACARAVPVKLPPGGRLCAFDPTSTSFAAAPIRAAPRHSRLAQHAWIVCVRRAVETAAAGEKLTPAVVIAYRICPVTGLTDCETCFDFAASRDARSGGAEGAVARWHGERRKPFAIDSFVPRELHRRQGRDSALKLGAPHAQEFQSSRTPEARPSRREPLRPPAPPTHARPFATRRRAGRRTRRLDGIVRFGPPLLETVDTRARAVVGGVDER